MRSCATRGGVQQYVISYTRRSWPHAPTMIDALVQAKQENNAQVLTRHRDKGDGDCVAPQGYDIVPRRDASHSRTEA